MTLSSGSRVTSAAFGAVTVQVVTSGTHPGSPVAGELIYETDTGLYAFYTGSAWSYPPQLIQTQTVSGSSTGTVTFNNIPQVFKELKVFISAKTQAAASIDTINFTINNISSANYNYLFQSVTGAGAPANQNLNGRTSGLCGLAWGSSPATNGIGQSEVSFPGYSRTGFAKTCVWESYATDGGSTYEAASGGSALNVTALSGAITRLDFITGAANYTSGSTIDLYGM